MRGRNVDRNAAAATTVLDASFGGVVARELGDEFCFGEFRNEI